jgi:molybdopterin-containing oxidoreductase family iron-sulfur binding subunit
MRNPDVTVRNRGVMEKCTYCVQRISQARIHHKRLLTKASEAPTQEMKDKLTAESQRALGSVVSACAQACPTQAIVFGDMNDPAHPVRQLKRLPTNYGLLDMELQTKPRTTYLAALSNPSKVLSPGAYESHGAHGGGHDAKHDAKHDAGHGAEHGGGTPATQGAGHGTGSGAHGAALGEPAGHTTGPATRPATAPAADDADDADE